MPLRRGRGMLASKPPNPVTRLLIVGFSQAGHMGSYLGAAAEQLGIDYKTVDASNAEARTRIGRSFYWHLSDKRPARLDRAGYPIVLPPLG